MAFRGILTILLVVGAIGLQPSDLRAEVVRLRSGEHDGFTRLVIDIGAQKGWKLGRTGTGYEFRSERADVSYDISTVFTKVPATRLQAVTAADQPGSLALAVSCDCHATAFETAKGSVVIDISDGKAPLDSAFEVAISEDVSAEPIEAANSNMPETPIHSARPTERVSSAGSATLGFRPIQNEDASLPIYWRDLAPPPDTVAVPETAAAGGNGMPAFEPPLPEPKPHRSADKGADLPTAGGTGETAEFVQVRAPSSEDLRAVRTPQAIAPPFPSAAVVATEDALLRQLSRAASQGLIKLEPSANVAAKPEEAKAGAAKAVSETAEGAEAVPYNESSAPQEHVAYHAETSVDRDAADNPMLQHLTGAGDACLPDAALDLGHWGDERPASLQLTDARAHLTGEFDRPDNEAVEKLVRLYLHFGMGAEARQILSSFDLDTPERALLNDLGMIMDERPVGTDSVLNGMRDCDGAVALWAFLAAPNDFDVNFADQQAVVRTFASLPAQLRSLLGPRVSNRLMAIGAVDSARAVRNAVALQAEVKDRTVEMIDAQMDLGQGKTAAAEAALDKLSEGNDALSSRAIDLAIRTRLEQGETVDPKQVASVAALAFEHRNSPDGDSFASLEILARAAAKDYAGAFDSYERWKGRSADADRRPTARQLFRLLAGKADDSDFVDIYFARRDLLAEAGADIALQLDLADRLARLGFAEDVGHVLEGDAGQTDRGQMLLASAALNQFEPQKALDLLAGSAAPNVDTLRAQAYQMLGDQAAAMGAYDRSGAREAAANAAWAAGNWQRAADYLPEIKKVLNELVPTTSDGSPLTEGRASLAKSKSVLDSSSNLRQALNTLLTAP
jgi:hypothetical protein